jgi:hypothetical protein
MPKFSNVKILAGPASVHCRALRAVAPVSLLAAACGLPTDLPRFESTFVVPAERIVVPVASQPVTASVAHDLGEAEDLARRARGGAVVIDVENPSGAAGSIQLRITADQADVTGTIDPRVASRLRLPLTPAEVQSILGNVVTLRASATLCPASGCAPGVPPGATVTLRARYELTLVVGTGGVTP